MTEHPMETTLCTALWRQFGAAIDMLENALLACPSTLWTGLLWSDPEALPTQPSGRSPITPSSGSTYISPAPWKDLLPHPLHPG